MKILYICGDDPSLTGCGTQQRTHHLHRALLMLGEVTVAVPPKDRTCGFFANLFRGFTKVARWPFASEKYVRELLKIGDKKFDAVVCRYMQNAAEFAAWKLGPLYLDVDDLPTQAFHIDKYRVPAGLRWLSAFLVYCWQKYVFTKCTGIWVVKKEDKVFLPNGMLCQLLPNLAMMPPKDFKFSEKQEKLLLTVGLMGHIPNNQGVSWFLKNVWPEFHNRHPGFKYVVAGGGLSRDIKDKWTKIDGVQVLGFVQDIEELYERAFAVVAPLMTGAGTCIKVIESALRGRKAFVTPFAMRGYTREESRQMGLEVFENSEAFIKSFEYWLHLREAERIVHQINIVAIAIKKFSFESFASKVNDLVGKHLTS